MLNPASFRAFANTLFSKTAWIATVALVASLLVVAPVGGQAANAVPIAMPSSISVGGSHSCVVVEGGVKCWGDNTYGQLGVEGIGSSSSVVAAIAAGSGATQVSAGEFHTCAVVSGGVKCWGFTRDGLLGNGESVDGIALPTYAIGLGIGSGVTQVSSGRYHSCAITLGVIWCWGWNSVGQLGVVSTPEELIPVVTDITGATSVDISIDANSKTTCAVVSSEVYCWGTNEGGGWGPTTGVLGSTELVSTHEPQKISGISGATSVSLGEKFGCAVASGGVQCWGVNNAGQLGNGVRDVIPDDQSTYVPRVQPVQTIPTTDGATYISTVSDFACAVVAEGVKCWGETYTVVAQVVEAPLTPTLVGGLDSGALAIEVGQGFACAVASGGVQCWGWNDSGQLGLGDLISSTSAVSIAGVSGLTGITALSAGDDFTCALAALGAVWCWGDNARGKLGDDGFGDSPVPVQTIHSGATALTTGEEHACAIVGVGSKTYSTSTPSTAQGVLCWGSNEFGQLGIGTVDRGEYGDVVWTPSGNSLPVLVDRLDGVPGLITNIAAGKDFTCAAVSNVVSGLEIFCWGDNGNGQYAPMSEISEQVYRSGPVPDPVPDPIALFGVSLGPDLVNETFEPIRLKITSMAAGDDATCAIFAGADPDVSWGPEVLCWGDTNSAQIGPIMGSPLTVGATAVATGQDSSCAVVGQGSTAEVYCWGYNDEGQLGQADFLSDPDDPSTRNESAEPLLIPSLRGATSVSVGEEFACATVLGAVKCWGLNQEAQLGNGTLTSSHFPSTVSGLTFQATLVATGVDHACAASSTQISCWGQNDDGGLGAARFGDSTTPVRATHVLSAATLEEEEQSNNTGGGQQSAAVDPATLLKPELAKANRLSVLKTGQRITLTGTNLSNVKSVMVGTKDAKILSSSGSEIVIEVPANLFGAPQVTLVSSSGIQTIDGLIQIVQPYVARSVKISAFKGNELTKASALAIRKSYLRDSSVNTVSCAAVIGKGTSARVKAATIAKSVSACSTVSGYSVKFSEFKIAVRILKTSLKAPYVTVTLSRSTPSLVN